MTLGFTILHTIIVTKMRVTEKWICCAAIAFVTDRLPDTGMRHRSYRSRRQQISQLLLTNRDYLNSGSSSDTDSHTRRILIHAVSKSFTAHIMVLMTMAAKSANAACLSGDIRPECIGIYKLPIDAAESPYVATPEKLKVYAPDLQWVPPTPYPTTYTAALKQLNDERQHLDATKDLISRGNIEEAGLALLGITPKVNAAGLVIVQVINKSANDERNFAMKSDTASTRNDGNPSSSPKAVTLEMKAYRIKTTLDELLGYLGETDVLIGQGLRGELGVSAPAQLQILSSLSNCSAEFDNMLHIIPDEL